MGSTWVWKAEKAAVPLRRLCRTYVRAPPGDWHISVRDGKYYCVMCNCLLLLPCDSRRKFRQTIDSDVSLSPT